MVGASLVQQCIRAGVLDEIHVDLVPVLLGDGVRLFDHLGPEPIELESTRVIEGAGVTHLTFAHRAGAHPDPRGEGWCHPHALPGPALNAAFPRLLLAGEWRCSGVSRSL